MMPLQSPKYYGVVCILDALGTKGVTREEEAELKFMKWRLIESLFKAIEENQPSVISNKDIVLRLASFSDTILITIGAKNKELATQSFETFAKLLRMIIRNTFSFDNLLRGSFSIGEYYQKEKVSLIFGDAVDDAAAFYERPLLAGIIATPRTSKLLHQEGFQTVSDMRFVEYNVPVQTLKKIEAKPISTLTFNTAASLPSLQTTRHNLAIRRQRYENRLKDTDNMEETHTLHKIVRKYKETEQFLDYAADHDPTVNTKKNDPST